EGLEVAPAALRELLDRLHQADGSLLEEVALAQSPVGALAGGVDHPFQVRSDQRVARLLVATGGRIEQPVALRRIGTALASGRGRKVLHVLLVEPLLARLRIGSGCHRGNSRTRFETPEGVRILRPWPAVPILRAASCRALQNGPVGRPRAAIERK